MSPPPVRSDPALTADDLEQIRERGLDPAEVRRQLAFFADPPPPIELDRPCRPGDGVSRLDDGEHARLEAVWKEAAAAGRFVKFVPASGAATRMFSAFKALHARLPRGGRTELERLAAGGDANTAEVLAVFDGLASLPFIGRLRGALAAAGEDPDEVLAAGDPVPTLRAMLEPDALGLAAAPKGLLDFHLYPDGPRTALEEHFVEAVSYLTVGSGLCRLHLTVLDEHRRAFHAEFDRFRRGLEQRYGVDLELELSTQARSTDTLAVDPDNRPFRLGDGRLLFRPGGHGALIGNLERLGADLVYVKNVDNVAPERLHPTIALWKRRLGGLLVELQARASELVGALDRGDEVTSAALELLRSRFAIQPPPAVLAGGGEARAAWIRERLQRPMRVAGVVPNVDEPGGGPFWVRGADGGLYGQIVEAAQIDLESPRQSGIWRGSSHFNPVDLVCALKRPGGGAWGLDRFVDADAAFIAAKTHGSRPLKALERPGLWNGAMAGWNTAFVEVPLETFNPVKRLVDLLRPQHQA